MKALEFALNDAVDAYDAKRCEIHGQPVSLCGMSEKNKKSIRPMIKAAIEGYLNALERRARQKSA